MIPELLWKIMQGNRSGFGLEKNLKTIRILKGFPQKYVAAQLNMSVSNLSNMENGHTAITLERLSELARIFGMSVQEIIAFNPEHLWKK